MREGRCAWEWFFCSSTNLKIWLVVFGGSLLRRNAMRIRVLHLDQYRRLMTLRDNVLSLLLLLVGRRARMAQRLR